MPLRYNGSPVNGQLVVFASGPPHVKKTDRIPPITRWQVAIQTARGGIEVAAATASVGQAKMLLSFLRNAYGSSSCIEDWGSETLKAAVRAGGVNSDSFPADPIFPTARCRSICRPCSSGLNRAAMHRLHRNSDTPDFAALSVKDGFQSSPPAD